MYMHHSMQVCPSLLCGQLQIMMSSAKLDIRGGRLISHPEESHILRRIKNKTDTALPVPEVCGPDLFIDDGTCSSQKPNKFVYDSDRRAKKDTTDTALSGVGGCGLD